MIVKKKKGNLILLLVLLLIIAVSIIASIVTYNENKEVLTANFYQKIQSFDLGYAQPVSLPIIFHDLFAIINYKIKGGSDKPELERIDIDIKFTEYQKILADRQQALDAERLINPTDVSARIRYRNKNIKAKVRLKGTLSDHWLSHYRMSLRVALKGNNYILGFKRFSLHKPEARQYPFDHIYSESMRATGNLASVQNYIHVFVNGTDWGVMNIEEHFSKEFLEKQKAKESLIVRFGDNQKYESLKKQNYNMYRLSNPRLYHNLYDSNSSLKNIINRKRLTYILEERLKKNHAHLYDIDLYSRALLMAHVWNDGHPLYFGNSRHYFNPYTLSLQPIPNDSIQPISIRLNGFFPRISFNPILQNEIYNQVVSTQEYKINLEENFKAVKSSLKRIKESTRRVQSYFPLDHISFSPGLLYENTDIINKNLNKISNLNLWHDGDNDSFSSSESVLIVHKEDGFFECYNLIPDTVFILQIIFKSKNILSGGIQLLPYSSETNFQPFVLKTSIKGKQDGKIQALIYYNGKNSIYKLGPSLGKMDYYIPPKPKSFPEILPPTDKQAAYFPDHVHVRHYDNGKIQIFNLIPDTITLEKVFLDKKVAYDTPLRLAPYDPFAFAPVTIETGLKGILDGKVTVQTSYKGNQRETRAGPTLVSEMLDNPLLARTPEDLPFLRKTDNNEWEINRGSWDITAPLVIQGNLTIQPGATLHFAEDSYLLVNKGALTAMGTPDSPITLAPMDNAWRGVYVNRAPKKSMLQHVHFNHTKELSFGLLDLTGAVTFYRADVILKDIVFNATQAEDSLNIVHSEFEMDHVRVTDTRSDGIDFDFSDGRIMNSYLGNIGGDALDFSGSKVSIIDTLVEKTQDKAVSAGEESYINITNLVGQDIGVGIASKDSSKVTGKNIRINNFQLYAVMSYVKKQFYNFSSVDLINLQLSDTTQDSFLAQDGCEMIINGQVIEQEKLDVEQLYHTGIMLK